MNVGDLVCYWFARKYPVFGIVLSKDRYEDHRFAGGSMDHPTYLYTIEILDKEAVIQTFDVYEGDRWEVFSVSEG